MLHTTHVKLHKPPCGVAFHPRSLLSPLPRPPSCLVPPPGPLPLLNLAAYLSQHEPPWLLRFSGD